MLRSQADIPIGSMIAGRPWSGILIEPKEGQSIVAWGFGFVPDEKRLGAFAIVLGRDCFGKMMRFRLWCRRAAGSVETVFKPGGSRGDKLLIDRKVEVVSPAVGTPIPRFFTLSLDAVRQFDHCLHIVEISFPDSGMLRPFTVGRSVSTIPWNWECGWFQVQGQPSQPAKRSRGLAWSLYAARDAVPWDSRSGDRHLAVVDSVRTRGFRLHVPALRLHQLTGAIAIQAREIRVPGPTHVTALTEPLTGGDISQLPYRFVDTLDSPVGTEAAMADGADCRALCDDGTPTAYRGWHCRYDLVSIDPADGAIILTLGEERALDPEEFQAPLPTGHVPLYSIYTTCFGIEAIPLSGWREGVHEGNLPAHLHWLETCRRRLPRVLRKLRQGHDLRLAGYGDSLTCLGGREPAQLLEPNGPRRDTLGYFERYGADWKAAVPVFARDGSRRAVHHRLGWNWYLVDAIEERFGADVTYLNWGVAGTTSGDDAIQIDGHAYLNGAHPDRLARMLDTKPDLVSVAFGMNDIGEQIDTHSNLLKICEAIQASGSEIIIIGLCQQNPGFNSRDHALWRKTHDQIMTAAEDAQVAYVPTWRILGDGNEGATGLSRWSHSCASMTNHPGARELRAVGEYLARIIP